jgi:amino acid permease
LLLPTNISNEQEKEEGSERLSAFDGALTIVSTILGGGIVGLPYAIYMLGLPLGIVLNLAVDYLSYESGMMYMALRSLMPNNPNSLYDIGYELLGRKSIFLNALTSFLLSYCLMLIYFIVLSSTLA